MKTPRVRYNALLALMCGLIGIASLPNISCADVTIEIDAGILRTSGGSALVPVGGLLQLIASPVNATTAPSGTFSAPNANSYVTGNNILVASFGMNYGNGQGETDSFVTFILGTGTTPIVQGEALQLRWFPSITYNSQTNYLTAAPGTGTTYGQYRSNTGEAGGMSWFVPADGSYTFPNPGGLAFNTATAGNSANPDTLGQANNTVAAVPEPSSFAFAMAFILGLLGRFVRTRRSLS